MAGKLFKWVKSLVRLTCLKCKYGKRLILDYSYNRKPVYIGKNVSVCIDKNAKLYIGGGTYISDNVQIAIMDNSEAMFGSNIYIGNGSRIFIRSGLKCENDIMFADNVSVYDHNHEYRNLYKPISKQGFSKHSIKIEEGSWLSTNVVVCKGAFIGKHVVVGANTVVQGVLDSNSLYVSNKAMKIKELDDNGK